MQIIAVDTEASEWRQAFISYLTPYEVSALFLLGNLKNDAHSAFAYYVAQDKGHIVGVSAYYPLFRSCSIFSESSEASRAFAQIMLERHTQVNTLLGMSQMIEPAYKAFIAVGRTPISDPEKDFFEMEIKDCVPLVLPDIVIRPVQERDTDAVVRLLRLIHHIAADLPITEQERIKVRASIVSFCVEHEGRVVAVAMSNGLAIRAFQILGVATDPAYQRKGYARALCSHLIQFMKKQGAQRVVVFTDPHNHAARTCYLGLGFQRTGTYYLGVFK